MARKRENLEKVQNRRDCLGWTAGSVNSKIADLTNPGTDEMIGNVSGLDTYGVPQYSISS